MNFRHRMIPILILGLLFSGLSHMLWGQKYINQLEVGDFIFQNGFCGDLCQAINTVTPAIYGKHYAHVGLVFKKENQWLVVEAIGDSVQINHLNDFINRSPDDILIGRLKRPYQKLIPVAINFALQQVGIPYDDDFLYDNGKYYCSELLYDAFKFANGQNSIFALKPMTFKAPGAQTYFENWVKYYQNRGMDIPEGQLGCNPGSLGNSKKLKIFKYSLD